jgi:3-oxoacyl-[acyl-carrier-protein] synthase-1
MRPLVVTAMSAVSAVGHTVEALRQALLDRRTGLTRCAFLGAEDLDTWIGEASGLNLPLDRPDLTPFDCRNNRLAFRALADPSFMATVEAARDHYGADRVATIIGTSTSGILETERAYFARSDPDDRLPERFSKNFDHTHNFFAPAEFSATVLGLTGPMMVISTACSSSAKAFASASRYIDAGLADAAVVGGVDSLCQTTLRGFNALELTSREPCRPFDVDRRGLSIGEAAAFLLLEKEGDDTVGTPVARFVGYGESSDAHHMSSPHPDGEGARRSMAQALTMGGIAPADVGYVNMHGTATLANDVAEARGVARLFPATTLCSSTKGWTGHTLGAAGALEAVIAIVAMNEGTIPGCLNAVTLDPAVEATVTLENREADLPLVMSNSFGFGGNNCSLLFGKVSS